MKNVKFNKIYIVLFVITILSLIYFSINKNSTPLEALHERYTMVKDHKLILTKETKNGIMVYSVGKVNNNKDNMYFVDTVRKSITDYK